MKFMMTKYIYSKYQITQPMIVSLDRDFRVFGVDYGYETSRRCAAPKM